MRAVGIGGGYGQRLARLMKQIIRNNTVRDNEGPWPKTSGGPLGCLLGCLIGLFVGASVLYFSHFGPFYYPICAMGIGAAIFGVIGWFLGKRFYREYRPLDVQGGEDGPGQ